MFVPCSIECVVSSDSLYMILSNENQLYCLQTYLHITDQFTHRTQNTYILHKHRHRIWNAHHTLYKKPFNPLLWSLIITYKTPGSIIISCLVKGKDNVESAETILTRILARVMDNREKSKQSCSKNRFDHLGPMPNPNEKCTARQKINVLLQPTALCFCQDHFGALPISHK